MSRYHFNKNLIPILEAAEQFKKLCFLKDGSLFSESSLWTSSLIQEVRKAFWETDTLDEVGFLDKLKSQMKTVSPDCSLLMAEMIWVLLLFVTSSKATTKRNQVIEVWSWSGDQLSASNPLLSEEVLSGIGNPGPAYSAGRWRELAYLFDLLIKFKDLSEVQRIKTLSAPLVFSEWLCSIETEGYRQFRHMLRYLFFPDYFERIVVSSHKRDMINHFLGVSADELKVLDDIGLDKKLYEIRKEMDDKYGRDSFDFYRDSNFKGKFPGHEERVILPMNINLSKLEEYQQEFLKHFPECDSFQTDNYINRERAYKVELKALFDASCRAGLENLPEDPSELAGLAKSLTSLFTVKLEGMDNKPQNLVGWRYTDFIRFLSDERAIEFVRAVAVLLYGVSSLEERITAFQNKLVELISSANDKAKAAQLRSITSFFLALFDVQKYGFIKTQELKRAIADLTGSKIIGQEGELVDVFEFFSQVRQALDGLGWKARDLIDVQSFLYVCQAYAADELTTPMSVGEGSNEDYQMDTNQPCNEPLNQILYGPPGTGKTYNTIDRALSIIDKSFLNEFRNERSKLKERFDSYTKQGRIHFVTFHQSFSYEDFVEGLRASSNEGMISYDVESGIFKSACIRANAGVSDQLDAFDNAIGLLLERCEQLDARLKLKTPRGKPFSIEYSGGNTFKLFPESTENENPNYVASISNVKKLYLTGSKKGIYNQSYVEGLLSFLKAELGLPDCDESQALDQPSEPVVLIIDEINRGNISSIFGELITLIEPSKRAGADEALSVTLPYSKEKFQVPSNLYLIGTMNTADRSLALMDTALRRRFDFLEMMPNIDELEDVFVMGVDIPLMLETMNRRIEVLYDREHTLGHAFFMPLKDEASEEQRFKLLQSIFANKVLPLLEEYFFEDWEKIRLVFGDNQKKENDHQFVIENQNGFNSAELFGANADLGYDHDDAKTYSRNASALGKVESYIAIYES